jgi:eukaryotic-like serine/threonine-protein kinase
VEQIGRYHIDGELGKGAMGVVYRGTDPNIGRTVALKTMRLDVHGIEAEEMLERFRNEARSAGVLNHPNIVTIYDAGEADGLFYMAMEVIEGQTLQQLLSKHHVLPVDQVLKVCRQVGEGLDFAHERKVIHRDVKPANIMITTSGLVKIMDFGIAKAGGGLTSTGQVLGTPNYMSPEQVKGKPLDGRSDLFSLGVVLYEMLTGEKPFGAENVTTIIYKIVHENPIAPRQLDVSIHPGLSAVIGRALSKNPEDRYQRGVDLATDLENYKSYVSDEDETSSIHAAAAMASTEEARSAAIAGAAAKAPRPVAARPASMTPAVEDRKPIEIKIKEPRPTAPLPGRPKANPVGNSSTDKTNKGSVYAGVALLMIVAAILSVRAIQNYIGMKDGTSPSGTSQSTTAAPANGGTTNSQSAAQAPGTIASKSPIQSAATGAAPFAPTGGMEIKTTPAGATVKLDGRKLAGATPITEKDLAPGKHTLQITAPGYLTALKSVDVISGATGTADVTLVAAQGVVKVSSVPLGADIFVDGVASNKKTPAEFGLAKGDHTFAMRLDGYAESGDLISVTPGQTITFSPTLIAVRKVEANPFRKMGKFFGGEDKGSLSVTTDPAGAFIFINGRRIPGQTPVTLQLPSGRYFMAVRKPGFAPVQKAVIVEKGKATTVTQPMLAREE